MILQNKVGNTVLARGDIVKSPSGSNEWVVINHNKEEIVLACISKYMTKKEDDLTEWYKMK